MKKILLLIILIYIGISTSFAQLPTTCANMDPICSDSPLDFTAESSGGDAEVGNTYDCLQTQPNPTWYYIQVANSGPINMQLSAGSDVDYILYGPYSSLANAQSYCGNMGTSGSGSSSNMVINCSYSPSVTETPNIPNALAGQVYVLLITNYANVVQTIHLEQTNATDAGAGLTDCSIVTPCSISSLDVTVGACDPGTNTFDVTGTVGITNPPSSGTLIAEDCNGNQTTVSSAPFTASSYNFAINNITSDGAACNIQVYFSADATCTQTLSYTNPDPCNPLCSITNFEVNNTGECNQLWLTDVNIEFISPPTTGDLVVEDCQGNITVIQSAPFTSPATGTFSTTDGTTSMNCDYTTYFTADPTCANTISFTPLPAIPQPDEAGTFTESMTGNGINTYILCDGDQFDMSSNGDSNIPPIAPGNDPSDIYFVYSCPPSPGGPGIDPTIDPCFVGFIGQAAITLINNGGSADAFLASLGPLTNNTFYLVPMTLGSLSGLTYQQNCYDLATEETQTIQYLNPITNTVASDCQAGTVTVSNLQGGYPEFYAGNYTASNLAPGTASFGNASAPLGGSIVVTGLNDGDVYSFDITDGNGCPITISGTFIGVEDPSFSYPDNSYCNTESDPSPTITGVTGGTFSVSPAGVTVNPTTGVIDLSSSTTGGTYTITYTTPAATCFGTQTFVVTIYPQPTVSAGTDQNICDGIPVVLAGSGASTYTWDNGVVDNVSFSQAIGSITYTVTGTDVNGCTNTDQVNVTVNPNPNPIITGPTEYCSGSTATLDAGSGFASYTWSTGASTQTINATDADNSITVLVTNAQGCSTTSAPFIVTENPTIITSASYQICQGASMVIHGVTETTSGVYSQTFPSSLGCDSTSNITLTVNPLPSVNAGVDQSICAGVSTSLTASGASTYTWNNGITQGATFTPAVGTITYTVTGTDANGCVNIDPVDIVVNPNPAPVITGSNEYCAGFYSTLDAGAGYASYTWSTGASTQTINATDADNPITVLVTTGQGCSATSAPFTVTENTTITTNASYQICQGASMVIHGVTETTSGVYSQTFPSSLGCDSTSNITLTVNPLPSVNAGVDQSICAGVSTSLTASGASTYTWDNGITQGATFTPAVGTITYTVTGTDANGCVNTDPIDITVNPLPNVNAGVDQSICLGQGTVTLAGSNAQTYTWDNGVVDNVSFSPTTTQTYTVTGTDVNGCINTDQVLVTVNSLPVVNAGLDQTVCDGVQVTLSGAGATSYTWNNGITNGVAFTQSVGTITYIVTGTDVNGCTNTDNVDVIVNPLPTINAGIDQTVCNGTQVTLNASGAGVGGTYTWDNGVPNGVPFTQTVGTTTYTVTGTDVNGCTDIDVVDIVVNAIPVVLAGPDQSVCIGSQVTLSASGSATYTWDNGVSDGVAFTPSTVGSTTYTVSGTTSGCTSTDQVVVTVNSLPTIIAGSDVSACENQTIILTAFGAGVGGTYSWDNSVTDGVSFLPTATTYTVTGTDMNGCINKDSLVVNIIPTPIVDFFGDKLLGCSPLSVSLTNNSTGNLTNCQWSFSNGSNITGCGSVSSTFTAVGCYDVTLTVNTPEGCTNTMTLVDYVCVLPNPIADFYTNPTELSTIDWEATMVNTSIGATSYHWTFGDGSSTSDEFEPKHPYPNEESGTYLITLSVENAGGCKDSTSRTISLTEDLIFYIPNTFTPDNDDYNEVFKPVFTSGFDPYNYTMYIFDRWGELLFESHNTNIGWDGTYGGKIVQDGTYIWKISVKRRDSDKYVEQTGHINILR